MEGGIDRENEVHSHEKKMITLRPLQVVLWVLEIPENCPHPENRSKTSRAR